MGCDIHPHVEVKRDGRWVRHDWQSVYNKGEKDANGYQPVDYDRYFEDPLYIDRNYSLFSILADVRNGQGFAGCDTGDRFEPIAPPRGLPPDVSREVFEENVIRVDEDHAPDLLEKWVQQGSSERIDSNTVTHPDHHSASYLTVAELLACDWDQRTKKRGWVDPWNFELFRTKGKPDSWSGMISGGSIEHVSNAWMRKAIDSGEIQWVGDPPPEGSYEDRCYTTSLQRSMAGWDLKKGTVGDSIRDSSRPRHYTNVEWEVVYRDCVKKFLEKTVPALQQLGSPDQVRLVFWFDN